MSSSGRLSGNVGLNQSRRPMRETKQAERFGHSEANANLEELIEASQPRTIAPAVRKGGANGKPSLRVTLRLPPSILSKATAKPSLWVTLPLPPLISSQAPTLPSLASNSARKIKIEDNSEAQPGPSSRNPRKRTTALVDEDEGDLFAPSSSQAPAPKRQRGKASVRKPRAAPKAKAAVKVEEDARPEPRGQPEVWAEGRQALCESLPYNKAFNSSAYTWNGFVYCFLLDDDNSEHGFMNEKVVITRLGGGMKRNKDTGKMEQTKDHSSSSHVVTSFLNNKGENLPLVLIVGAKNLHCPVKVPHRYNVLGLFHVTDVWSEKIDGLKVCRARLEMIDLKTPSWWGIRGSPLPTSTPDYTTKAPIRTCNTCKTPSKQVSAAGWMCLNETCANFSTDNGEVPREAPTLNPAFIDERYKWSTRIIVPMGLKPAPPTGILDGSFTETSVQAWKGMVCPDCGRCNSRKKWDEWKCETEGCTFEIPIRYNIIPASQLVPDHVFKAEGHSIPFDKWEAPVIRTEAGFQGYWRKQTYELSPGNYVTHYLANEVINRQPHGADVTLNALQAAKLGMQRFPMKTSPVEGVMVTKHFGMNFGLPYDYVVAIDSRGFSEAPPAILDALNHLTWAGKDTVTDGSFRPFNELLCLAYMEEQEIGWHDDGEEDLGPDIASWSLGGSATMEFRMKVKHWTAKNLDAKTYDPELWVRPGSQGWKLRVKANELFKAGRMAEYEATKAELFKSAEMRRKSPPTILNLDLKHGDIVVMHGEQVQSIHDHAVIPKGKLRYGLTGRYIKPENIPVSEHWKGAFIIAPDNVYDGDVALFRANFPEEEDN